MLYVSSLLYNILQGTAMFEDTCVENAIKLLWNHNLLPIFVV